MSGLSKKGPIKCDKYSLTDCLIVSENAVYFLVDKLTNTLHCNFQYDTLMIDMVGS